MSTKLNEVNELIQDLLAEKRKILDEEDESTVAYIKSLEWVSNSDATFYINYSSVNGSRYQIRILSKMPEIKDCARLIKIFHEDSVYDSAMFYKWNSYSIDFNYLETGSAVTMFSFLNKYKFKSMKFNNSEAKLLSLIYNTYKE